MYILSGGTTIFTSRGTITCTSWWVQVFLHYGGANTSTQGRQTYYFEGGDGDGYYDVVVYKEKDVSIAKYLVRKGSSLSTGANIFRDLKILFSHKTASRITKFILLIFG